MVCSSNGNYWTADIKVMLFWWSDPRCIPFQSQVASRLWRLTYVGEKTMSISLSFLLACTFAPLNMWVSTYLHLKKCYYMSSYVSYTLLLCPSNLLIRKINVWINVNLSAFSLPPMRWCWVALLLCSVYQPACTCVAMDCIICRLWGLPARKLNWKNPETDWSC